jgi:hypothetical protein
MVLSGCFALLLLALTSVATLRRDAPESVGHGTISYRRVSILQQTGIGRIDD